MDVIEETKQASKGFIPYLNFKIPATPMLFFQHPEALLMMNVVYHMKPAGMNTTEMPFIYS